jgi:putative molybdopterin biosynthesis protein
VGSEAGLEAAKRGACDVAPIHLLDAASGVYNEPFMTDALELVRGYGRMQGVIYRRGDARFEGRDAAAAVGDATNLAMINRNRGSGTRALYDRLLQGREPPGHSIEASSHHAVAAAVEQSRADWGIAIDAVAVPRGLGFLPITEERFDFALPRRGRRRAAVAAFCDVLGDARVLAALRAKGFSA